MATQPKKLETVEQKRERQRNEALGLEMLTQLETQVRDILDSASAIEGDDGLQTFASYRDFRQRLSEFEAFCNVIENQLGRLAGDKHALLAELFRKRRAMVLKPAIAALNAFFERLADGGPLPLGLSDVLKSELRALDDIREMAATPGALDESDMAIIADVERLEQVVKNLVERSVGLADFSDLATPADLAIAEQDD
jgi:hypothetical protein